MIATTIGRTFLNAYNEKYEHEYSAKEFFEKEYFECFFNHPKYMQWVTNSPFVQMKAGQKPHLLNTKERKEKLESLFEKIDKGESDASIAIGFPASEEKTYATTSGLITDIDIKQDTDDVYFSWIGGGLGVGIAGGYSIFFNHKDILLSIYEGWKIYRDFLNDDTIARMRGNQINTWNGQWLNYRYGKEYRSEFDFQKLQNSNVFTVNDKLIEVNTIKWSELFFNISRTIPDKTTTGYVYSLGQTNKTLGFYPFYFTKARKLISYYKILFGENQALEDAKQYESLFGIHIKRACELGSIGLQALEPKDLRKYFGKDSNMKLTKPKYAIKKGESDEDYSARKEKIQIKDETNLITYRTYKTWLIAMITKNKEESLEYTAEVAQSLHQYVSATTKTDRKNLVNTELLSASNKKKFLDALVSVIKNVDEESLVIFKNLRERVHLMPAEDFGYFLVLLKFDYAYQDRINLN